MTNGRKLLADSKAGVNPLEGWTPEVPVGETVTFGSEAFDEAEAEGLAQLADGGCGFVLVRSSGSGLVEGGAGAVGALATPEPLAMTCVRLRVGSASVWGTAGSRLSSRRSSRLATRTSSSTSRPSSRCRSSKGPARATRPRHLGAAGACFHGIRFWPLQDIVLLRGFCARINHPCIAPSHLHCPHSCNTIARLLRSIRRSPRPLFCMPYTKQ